MELINYLKRNRIQYNKGKDNLTVGGYLYLSGTGITSLPDNLTVGSYLYLSGTGITSLPDNLTVGGSLYLSGTGITSLPDNLTVGGYLDLSGTGITKEQASKIKKEFNANICLSWKKGKYRKIDGIFCEVIKKFRCGFKIKIGLKVSYIIEVDGVYSHGDTLSEAKESLKYKISNRDTSAYSNLTLSSILTQSEAIKLYRVITGACESGTRHYVESLENPPQKLTVKKLIKITSGQYNHDLLVKFFDKNGERQ